MHTTNIERFENGHTPVDSSGMRKCVKMIVFSLLVGKHKLLKSAITKHIGVLHFGHYVYFHTPGILSFI